MVGSNGRQTAEWSITITTATPLAAPPSQISQHSYLWSPDDHPKHCLEYFPTPAPPKIDLVTNHNKIHLATPIP